jgi:hypothetical protein
LCKWLQDPLAYLSSTHTHHGTVSATPKVRVPVVLPGGLHREGKGLTFLNNKMYFTVVVVSFYFKGRQRPFVKPLLVEHTGF